MYSVLCYHNRNQYLLYLFYSNCSHSYRHCRRCWRNTCAASAVGAVPPLRAESCRRTALRASTLLAAGDEISARNLQQFFAGAEISAINQCFAAMSPKFCCSFLLVRRVLVDFYIIAKLIYLSCKFLCRQNP